MSPLPVTDLLTRCICGLLTGRRRGGMTLIHHEALKTAVLRSGLACVEDLNTFVNCDCCPSRVHRPPDPVTDSFCNAMVNLFDQLMLIDRRFVVYGDFNCPDDDERNPLEIKLRDYV
jgi:hypothetical protein